MPRTTTAVDARRARVDLSGLRPADLLALYSAPNIDHFTDHLFRILPRLVRCDYVSVFYQRAGDGFLKERDSRGRVWSGAFMRRYVELTPAIPMVRAHPGIALLTTSVALTASDADLRRTAFHREVMQRQGWRHGAALCFWAAPSAAFPIFVVTMYRASGRPDFATRELAALEAVHPFLAPAVGRFHERSAADAVSEGVATVLRRMSPGIVVMDWQLRIVRATPAGRRAIDEWRRSSPRTTERAPSRLSVPSTLLQACHELREELTTVMRRAGQTGAQRRRYVAHPQSLALLASVTVVSLNTALAEATFVIEFETPEANGIPTSQQPSELARLTKSEREVALVVADGWSNQETADRLGKTLAAVKFLLHRTYQKLGVPNRARLCVLLRGRTGADGSASVI